VTPDPDVTVILLPAANAAGCADSYAEALPRLLRSLASIGDDPLAEIIVVEALADPAVAVWLATRVAADARLVRPRGPRCGPARARNLAIASARAPLVAFLEAGDVWCPRKLGPQRALHAGHPQLGFSFTDAANVAATGQDGGRVLAGWPRFRARHGAQTGAFLLGPDARAQLSAEPVVATSTVVARTELLRGVGGFSADPAPTAARDLWQRLAERAPVACRLDVTVEVAAPHAPMVQWAAE
jgi:hypothetical protein